MMPVGGDRSDHAGMAGGHRAAAAARRCLLLQVDSCLVRTLTCAGQEVLPPVPLSGLLALLLGLL